MSSSSSDVNVANPTPKPTLLRTWAQLLDHFGTKPDDMGQVNNTSFRTSAGSWSELEKTPPLTCAALARQDAACLSPTFSETTRTWGGSQGSQALSVFSDQEHTCPEWYIEYQTARLQEEWELDQQAVKEGIEEASWRRRLLTHTLIDRKDDLPEFLNSMDKVAFENIVDLCIDVEGGSGHGRDCNINFIQVKSIALDRTWILDMQALGQETFDTPAATGQQQTFGQILQDDKIPKLIFDVRADSDSIKGHYGVHLRGVIDLQIMELATRRASRKYCGGLDKCFNKLPLTTLSWLGNKVWNQIKDAGQKVCRGPLGYGAFDMRPVADVLRDYAVNDVSMMPLLYVHYLQSSCSETEPNLGEDVELMQLVLKLSADRVTASIHPDYAGNTPMHNLGPQELRDLWPEISSDDY